MACACIQRCDILLFLPQGRAREFSPARVNETLESGPVRSFSGDFTMGKLELPFELVQKEIQQSLRDR